MGPFDPGSRRHPWPSPLPAQLFPPVGLFSGSGVTADAQFLWFNKRRSRSPGARGCQQNPDSTRPSAWLGTSPGPCQTAVRGCIIVSDTTYSSGRALLLGRVLGKLPPPVSTGLLAVCGTCSSSSSSSMAPPSTSTAACLKVRFRMAVFVGCGMGKTRLAAPPPPYAWQEVVVQVLKIKGERVGCTLAKRPPSCASCCSLDGLALCA